MSRNSRRTDPSSRPPRSPRQTVNERPTNPNSTTSSSNSRSRNGSRRNNRSRRSSTADDIDRDSRSNGYVDRSSRGSGGRSPRNSPRKREAVSAGYFAPQVGGSRGSGRGGKRSGRGDAQNPVIKEAALLPIEWRCRTPPQRHDEVSFSRIQFELICMISIFSCY